MKKIAIYFVCLVAAVTSSCDDYLDINDNPNSATAASPKLVLPQALTTTALVLNGYNSYGMQIGGYAANAGGYGGFNETVTYAYTPSNYSTLWGNAFDNLEDYQYVIEQTEGVEADIYYHAVAKIMKAHNFALLVDTYNDVPFSEALKGAGDLSPAYDEAADVYAGIATLLDEAMAEIETGNGLALVNDIDDADVLFGGDMEQWLRLANTLKLKLLVKGDGFVTFTSTALNAIGFLEEDALIDPGYTRDANRQNPKWNSWGFAYNGPSGTKSWIPSTWILAFYDDTKIDDPYRGSAIYLDFPSTGTNQLGFENTSVPASPDGTFWYPGSERDGELAGDTTGVLKGPEVGFPLFTAAESYFLQAEGALDGIAGVSGTAKANFEAGIEASFRYLYMLPDGTQAGDYEDDVASYFADNVTNDLVNFDLAAGAEEQLEAIITQKYVALNMVNSQEGWAEYQRTGYPKVSGTAATTTFASVESQSTRPDKLPSRILYPNSEFQYNGTNVPQGINSFTSKIFWAK